MKKNLSRKILKSLAAFTAAVSIFSVTLPASAATSIDTSQSVIWSPDASAYVLPDVNSRYLSAKDFSGFSNMYLLIARNEIYARHGYLFLDSNISRYFEAKDWYSGTTDPSDFSEDIFNKYEQANLELIQSVEEQRGSTVTTIAWTDDQTTTQSTSSVSPIDVSQTVIWEPMADAYVIPDGNKRYLSADELSGYSDLYLLIARNEFYARRGYIFNDDNIARYFEGKDWYNGTTDSAHFSGKIFNDYEQTNIDLIKSVEKQRNSAVSTITWTN